MSNRWIGHLLRFIHPQKKYTESGDSSVRNCPSWLARCQKGLANYPFELGLGARILLGVQNDPKQRN